MLPPTHLLVPFALGMGLHAAGVVPFWVAVVAGAAGLLVDADHYVEYVARARSHRFSLRRAWNNAVRFHRFEERSFVHHWKGFVFVVAGLAVVALASWRWAFALGLGYLSHIILDHIHVRYGASRRLGRWYVHMSRGEEWLAGAALAVSVVLVV